MISIYNIAIFLTIILSMATMRPPTIASVLASNSVGTSAASASSGSSGSSTASANQAQLAANKKAAAEREAARQNVNSTPTSPSSNTNT